LIIILQLTGTALPTIKRGNNDVTAEKHSEKLATMKRPHSKRLTGGQGTAIAQQRYGLYKLANEQLKVAYEAGFYIECVSICESIISDRIEARLQFLRRDTDKPSHIDSLGRLLKQVTDIEPEDQIELRAAYVSIREWGNARNETIHQFVKVTDQNQGLDGKGRIRNAKTAARNGIRLMKMISTLVRKHNKWTQK
jgi:hypothetical protein